MISNFIFVMGDEDGRIPANVSPEVLIHFSSSLLTLDDSKYCLCEESLWISA